MAEKKDYLNELSKEVENKKIASFQEEKVVRVEKPKRSFNPKMLIGILVLLIAVGGLAWFFLFRPTIEMPSFVGENKKDVMAWVSQQGIDKSGVIFKEEYNFDYDEDVVVSQDVEAGTKVKEDTKFTFVVSIGADPEEKVNLMDLEGANINDIKDWVSENKLQKVKFTTKYSDTVEKDIVIDYVLKVDPSDFRRNTALSINVSKGPQPAGTVTVEDFKDKDKTYVESWAKQKKVEVEFTEVYHDTVNPGLVISQSIEANKTMKDTDKLLVTVSKGKGIKVPNFATMTNQQVDSWIEENQAVVKVNHKYSNDTKYVLAQSVGSNSTIGTDAKIEITLNKGNSFYMADVQGPQLVGGSYERLVDWANSIRYMGIDAFAGQWNNTKEVYSEKYTKGTIVSVECTSHSTGEKFACDGKLPLDVRFDVIVSKGLIQEFDISSSEISSGNYNVSKLIDILASHNIPFDNYSNGQTCTLEINGQPISTNAVRITEGDKVVLGKSSETLPEPSPETNVPDQNVDKGEN